MAGEPFWREPRQQPQGSGTDHDIDKDSVPAGGKDLKAEVPQQRSSDVDTSVPFKISGGG